MIPVIGRVCGVGLPRTVSASAQRAPSVMNSSDEDSPPRCVASHRVQRAGSVRDEGFRDSGARTPGDAVMIAGDESSDEDSPDRKRHIDQIPDSVRSDIIREMKRRREQLVIVEQGHSVSPLRRSTLAPDDGSSSSLVPANIGPSPQIDGFERSGHRAAAVASAST